jgi:hypothetical protein
MAAARHPVRSRATTTGLVLPTHAAAARHHPAGRAAATGPVLPTHPRRDRPVLAAHAAATRRHAADSATATGHHLPTHAAMTCHDLPSRTADQPLSRPPLCVGDT